MYTKNNFTGDNFDAGLIAAVGNRLESGAFTDAILAGTKYLTDILREKGQCEGDGVQLVGQVLGGAAPKIPINKLQTVSEKDEQKGLEQLLRGYYIGIRNPRTHEATEDTEEFCIKMMVLIETILQFLNREVDEFDVETFVDKIYDPYFVASDEYAQSLVSQVPNDKLVSVFNRAFIRRTEGEISQIKFAFLAIYHILPEVYLSGVIECVGNALRETTEPSEFTNLFALLKPNAWQLLQSDVKMRAENIIIDSCSEGRFNIHSGIEKGSIGTWGVIFGRYFSRKDDLCDAILSRLVSDWYTQNYVGKYFMYFIPTIISNEEQYKTLADNLTYAALSNQATIVRSKLLEVCGNYPEKIKKLLTVNTQERRHNDPAYAEKLLEALS
jgi:uncharacterized protein (TIGR02391 family)